VLTADLARGASFVVVCGQSLEDHRRLRVCKQKYHGVARHRPPAGDAGARLRV